jgi:hypothetical protein
MDRTQGRKLGKRECDNEGKDVLLIISAYLYEAIRGSGEITKHILNFGSR